jgi:drug/metabolite transporter (DMT)-like permease
MKICFGGFIDLIAAILNSIALNYVAGSVYQMMRGGTIAATFFFSIVSLKMKAQKHQYIGSGLAIIGLMIVGISNFIYKSSKEEDEVIRNEFRSYSL